MTLLTNEHSELYNADDLEPVPGRSYVANRPSSSAPRGARGRCEVCGAEFESARASRRYCSRKCKGIAERRRKS